MNLINVAIQMIPLIDYCDDKGPGYSKDHLLEMVRKIQCEEVTGEKAHRWIGWIQGCVCVCGGATLEELKLINKKEMNE